MDHNQGHDLHDQHPKPQQKFYWIKNDHTMDLKKNPLYNIKTKWNVKKRMGIDLKSIELKVNSAINNKNILNFDHQIFNESQI